MGKEIVLRKDEPVMIPQKIQPFFKVTHQNESYEDILVEGSLTCCNSHNFEVHVVGTIKNRVFSKAYLLADRDRVAIDVCCKKCGKTISVFDSDCDGYESCVKKQLTYMPYTPIACRKCQKKDFSISIKYEYSDIQELDELDIAEKDNAFTWIWITLECNNCKIKYKNFIDFDTT